MPRLAAFPIGGTLGRLLGSAGTIGFWNQGFKPLKLWSHVCSKADGTRCEMLRRLGDATVLGAFSILYGLAVLVFSRRRDA